MEQTNPQPTPGAGATAKAPLTPIDQLLGASWNFFKANARKLLLIALIMLSPAVLNQILVIIFGEKPNPVIAVIMGILGLLSIVTGIWGTLTMITFVKEKNSEMTISEAFNKSISLFWTYLWASIIIGILVMIGFILLIIPGIILSVYFGLYSYVLVCENIKGYNSAEKSKELVKNYWWALFGRMIILALIYIAIMIILSPLSFIHPAIFGLISIIVSLLVSPFATIYFYSIYQNLKQIKNI